MEENNFNQTNNYQSENNKKEKGSKNILLIVLVAVISGFVGSALSYSLISMNINNLNQSSTNNTKYEISQIDSPVVAIAEKASKSIVGVKVKYMEKGFWGQLQESGSEGSGIIYSSDGYIITNEHVIRSAVNNGSATVQVTLPGEEEAVDAVIVGYDKTTDLAVLKIEKTGLNAAEFGSSSDLKVGEIVAAIGNPLGQQLASSVTDGIVSALNRKITADGTMYNLIQTNAAINPGNSGGALLNSKGQVVGINTVKISSSDVEGLGFAIPIDDAKPIIDELITNKKIKRPYIGIYGENVDKRTASDYNLKVGVFVTDLVANSPASKSGVQKGDIITKIDGKEIKTMDDINEIKYNKKIGDTITITVYRSEKEVDLKITLEEES